MKSYDDIKIGEEAITEKIITDKMIREFANISNDQNPVHLDEEFAKTTRFRKRIAHGMLIASFISSAIANELPGPGSIYLSQSLQFKRPVYIGDKVYVKIIVISKNDERKIIGLETLCMNAEDKVVILGEAKILYEDN